MRAGNRFECPECGERFARDLTCFRCEVSPVDEHGNAPPPPTFERITLHGDTSSVVPRLLPLKAAYLALALSVFADLTVWISRNLRRLVFGHRARRRVERLLDQTPCTPIALAHSGYVRVRGVVELLEPAVDDVAFFLRQTPVGHHAIDVERGCGAFLVRDGSGRVAFVDDDFVEIRSGSDHPATGSLSVVARHGMEVEVMGNASPKSLDVHNLDVLCFDGRPDALLMLAPVP